MGRRKIEIKAIKDDRNRSVTFLKRKAGLFKKAHELSVLCSVDVAVIIFGHNKKLYEFSSGDMRETLGRYQYYGSAHEHKGPTDFSGKQNLDDEEEDDVSPEPEEMPPHTQGMVQPSMHNQPTFQHINSTASASPPIANGLSYHARHGTPQPAGISRPSSRNNIQRVNSNLVPQGQHPHSTPPPPQNGYAYMPNPPAMYNAPPNANMGPQPPRPQYQYSHPPPVPQHPPVQPPMPAHPPSHHPQAMQPQHPPQQHTPQPPHQPFPQSQQAYLHEQQRQQSMPPTYSQQEAKPAPTEPSPPQQQGEVKPEDGQSPPPPKPLPSKSRSIFTPIDDRGSVLAQHFGFGPPSESPKTESPAKTEPDSAEATTTSSHAPTLPPPPVPPHASRAPAPPQRTHSLSSMPDIPPISRQNSLQMGAKRPRLKVQIPSENSDAGSGTADSSPRDSGNTAATPAKGSSETGGHSAVVLPPPSPSASALLSAGAQGPPNPFARPPPPAASNSAAYNNNNIDTPISALPSRFVSDTLLPSPSSFYPEWGFGRSGPDSNMLPSPLTFPTPVAHNGPAYPRDAEEAEKKRKSSDENVNAPEGSNGKRLRVE